MSAANQEYAHVEGIELGEGKTAAGGLITNPTYRYYEKEEKLHGFLSQQFPTTANPAPLGLAAFALTTFVLSMLNAGAIVSKFKHSHNNQIFQKPFSYVCIYTFCAGINSPSQGVVLGLALFYGGLVQLLAGMWEFKTGNTYGALAFTSYGGFWMSFAALFITSFGFMNGYATATAADINNGLGIYLLSWCMFSTFMFIASHRTTVVLFVLFFFVALTFLMLSIGRFCDNNIHLQKAGGVFGIIAAAIAWYGSFAGLLTKKNSYFTLPVGELHPIYVSWGWVKDDKTI